MESGSFGGRVWKIIDKMWCKYCRDTQDNIAIFMSGLNDCQNTFHAGECKFLPASVK